MPTANFVSEISAAASHANCRDVSRQNAHRSRRTHSARRSRQNSPTLRTLLLAFATSTTLVATLFAPANVRADTVIENNTTQGNGSWLNQQNSPQDVTIGGAGNLIMRNNNAFGDGGVAHLSDTNGSITFEATNGFILASGNKTGTAAGNYFNGGDGGVISVNQNVSGSIYFKADSNITLQNNIAQNGGVMSMSLPNHGINFEITTKKLYITGNKAAYNGGAFFLTTTASLGAWDANVTIQGVEGGSLSDNLAAQKPGASLETGGAFHLYSKNGECNFGIDGSAMAAGDTFTIKGNRVGTGANSIQRAIYIENHHSALNPSQPWSPAPIAGRIHFDTGAGTIELYDEIKAIKDGSQAGFAFIVTGTTGAFAQIGNHGNVYSKGFAEIVATHRLESGARFQTYEQNATRPFGWYELFNDATFAAKGTGNVLATKQIQFETDSILSFDLTGTSAGNTVPLVTFESVNQTGTVVTSSNYVTPGANKVEISGNITAPGDYYLLAASDFGTNSVATTGTLTAPNFTLNGNPIVERGTNPNNGARQFADYQLFNYNPAAPDSDSNKLYLQVGVLGGNIKNDFVISNLGSGNNDTTWKNNAPAQTAGHTWEGILPNSGTNPTPQTTSFLNGDLVTVDTSAYSGFPLNVYLDGNIHVGSLTLRGQQFSFSGGTLAMLENVCKFRGDQLS